jgi:DNA-binding XRE family transcriptional regulator
VVTTEGQSSRLLADGAGRYLRRLRQRRGLTLASLAAQVGLSESFLSQLERGRTGVSLDSLARLAHALDIRVADLFEPDHTRGAHVVRGDARPQLDVWHLGRKTLLTPRRCEHLEVMICRLEPGGATGEEPFTHGDSDELLLILEGAIDLELDSDVHHLEASDSITFRTSVPHRTVNRSGQVAEGLWVISPPSF